MSDLDNPAGRLHTLLVEMVNYDADYHARTVSPYTRPSVESVLRSVFKLGSDVSESEIFLDVLELHKLIDEVERNMKVIALIDEDLYKEPLQNIREFLAFMNLSERWEDRRTKIDNGDIRALIFCSRALSKSQYRGVETIPQEEIDKLIEEVQKLYNTINSSVLNVEVKNIILDQLEIIRRALHDYRLRGISSLRDALERNIGSLVLNNQLFEEVAESTEELSDYKKFLSRFASVVAFTSHATAIGERMGKYLPAILQ